MVPMMKKNCHIFHPVNPKTKSLPTLVYMKGMNQWLLAVTSDPVAKGSANNLEVAGVGPVHCHFFLPLISLPYVVLNAVFHSCHHGT